MTLVASRYSAGILTRSSAFTVNRKKDWLDQVSAYRELQVVPVKYKLSRVNNWSRLRHGARADITVWWLDAAAATAAAVVGNRRTRRIEKSSLNQQIIFSAMPSREEPPLFFCGPPGPFHITALLISFRFRYLLSARYSPTRRLDCPHVGIHCPVINRFRG